MGMCKLIFKDATGNKNGRQRSTPKKFVGAKTLKLNVRNYSNLQSHSPQYGDMQVIFYGFAGIFLRLQKLSRKLLKFYNHIPHDMEMCVWFFQGFKEIQNGRHA